MKKYISSVVAAALVSTFMVGCSDSNDSEQTAEATEFNGIFVDSAVGGVSYACGTKSGVTDALGYFGPCLIGTTVSFSIGNVSLGEMTQTSNNIFTPSGLAATNGGTEEEQQEEANKIASLLLSLDTDGDPTNGVEITPETIEVLNSEVTTASNIADVTQEQVDEVTNDVVETIVAADPESLMEVVTAEEAESHLEEIKVLIDDGNIVAPPQPTPPATTGAN